MNTKIKYFYCLFILAALLSSTACTGDLNDSPEGSTTLSADNVFGANLDGYLQGLAQVYGGLGVSGPNGAGSSNIQDIDSGFGQYIRALFMMQEVPTDEAILGWNDAGVADLVTGQFSSNNVFINAMYQRIMNQVAVCNSYLRQTTDDLLTSRGVSTEDQAKIRTYRAEVRLIRALCYFHGMDIFGNMSFVTESDPVSASFQPPQISRADLFKYIETEAIASIDNLSAPKTAGYGHADQAAAWMLLATVYLNAKTYTGTERYADCLNYASKVINSSYIIAPISYRYLFYADNNTNGAQNENILVAESDGTNQQSYGNTTFIIHAATGGSMSASGRGIDGGWAGLRARPEFIDLTTTPSGSDSRRLFYTVGQTKPIAQISQFTNGYAVTKFSNIVSTTGLQGKNATFTDTDFPIFRTADAYLMYAEAQLRGGGGSATSSLNYVNALRTRAGASALTSLDLNVIFNERSRELYWECHRRTDLIRFGKYSGSTYNWSWKNNVQLGAALPATAELMPIPYNVMVSNQNLSQNPGY